MSTQHNTGSRRRFLKTVGGTAVIGTLAGCLGGGGGSGDSTTLTHLGMGGQGQESVEAKMREWAETRDEDITVEGEFFTNNIEIMNGISENPNAYDITSTLSTNGFVLHELQYDGGLFTEIDTDRIPNYTENVAEAWRSEQNPVMVDNPWGVYNFISSQGLGYNADEVDNPTSWDAVKRDELSGKVSHFDAGITRYVSCAIAAGLSPSEGLQDDAVYEEIWDEARRQDQYVESYWRGANEIIQLYREESVFIGEAFGGSLKVLQEDDLPIEYFIPEEGAYPGGGAWAIVEESDNKDLLYDFLNWVYRRENAVDLSERQRYPVPIKDPPESVRELPDYVEHPDRFADVDLWTVVPAAQQLAQKWAEVKA